MGWVYWLCSRNGTQPNTFTNRISLSHTYIINLLYYIYYITAWEWRNSAIFWVEIIRFCKKINPHTWNSILMAHDASLAGDES